jgi:hypothetical protein
MTHGVYVWKRYCWLTRSISDAVNSVYFLNSMKSRGKNPNAPITALMSPKNGSIAAKVVAMMTDSDREIILGITFRVENSLLFGSPNVRSSTPFVG